MSPITESIRPPILSAWLRRCFCASRLLTAALLVPVTAAAAHRLSRSCLCPPSGRDGSQRTGAAER